jgi:hypothetical protein
MATAVLSQQPLLPDFSSGSVGRTQLGVDFGTKTPTTGLRDVHTELHYYKDNEDGSPPHPTYIDRPETYERPFETHPVTVHDVRGRDHEFTLDSNGFQFFSHTATEKDFVDDEQVKASYYPEVAQLLKEA